MSKSNLIRMDLGNWIAVVLVAAAAALYMMLWFLPQMRSISAAQDQLERNLTYVLEAQKSDRASEAAQRELDAVLAYVDKHDEQMISQDDLPTLYRQISQISKSHDAITSRFEPRPAVPYESFRTASLSLGVKGPFVAIHGLVRDLEALGTRIWIDEMQIKGNRESEKPAECDLVLVVFIDNPEKSD